MAVSDWLTTLKATLRTINASHSFLSGDLHSNAPGWLLKRALAGYQRNKQPQKHDDPRWARLRSASASPSKRRRGRIFIILLNCAWCAIGMEISPVRDDEFFMSRAVFDLQTMSRLYFSPHDELIETLK